MVLGFYDFTKIFLYLVFRGSGGPRADGAGFKSSFCAFVFHEMFLLYVVFGSGAGRGTGWGTSWPRSVCFQGLFGFPLPRGFPRVPFGLP